MTKFLALVFLGAVAFGSFRSAAQESIESSASSVPAPVVTDAPSVLLGEALNTTEAVVQSQNEKEYIPFGQLPLAEKIKRIVALTVFCAVLALYWLRNKIGAWVEGKSVWVRVVWSTLCVCGRYVVRPILIMMKWMILLPLLLFCKMFKLGGKAAWITAKLTGKAAWAVAKEVKITGGAFGEPSGGSSTPGSSGCDEMLMGKREAERRRKEEAERNEKADKTPISAIVQSNGTVLAKNRVGKILFGVTPNGKNATAYCSDGCLVVNSTAGNGTRYVQIWDASGKMVRTEAQPK